MTKAYDRFKKDLVAQGRERLDGFSLDFSGLTDAERNQVRQELTVLLKQHDSRAPEALYELDGQASVPQIAAELAMTPITHEDFRLAASGTLFEATSDIIYMHTLEDLLLHAESEYVRTGAAGRLADVPNVAEVDSVLFSALGAEKDEDMRSWIASCLLKRFGITSQTRPLWKAYARRLSRGTQEEREKAYAELQELRKREIG